MTIYKDQLEAVYKLIEKPENWTKGWFARTERGEEVAPRDKHATCWCVEGALCKVLDVSTLDSDGLDARQELECKYNLDASFNDSNDATHAEILTRLQEAIKHAPVRP
jgi:hypothetical protein